jgi:hypothetical protein
MVTRMEAARHTVRNLLGALSLMAGSLFLSGCGGAFDSMVAGTVTLDGKIVPRGLVAFHPVAAGPAAYAQIDESGKYNVRTGRDAGLPPGEYQVTVTASEPPAVEKTANGFPPPPGKAITPARYGMKETSALKFSVEPGKNEINLELSSQPAGGNGKK